MQTELATRTQAAHGLLLFFALLLPLTGIGYWFWIERHEHLVLIFVPAMAAVATRLLRREGFGDVSFHFRRRFWPAAAWAVAVPLVACCIAYGAAWSFGLVHFEPARLPHPFPNLPGPLLNFVWTVFLAATVVTGFFLPLAAGEELGWRGYMLTRLIDAGVPRPVLVSGLIWAGWHVPLILLAAYGPGGGPPAAAALIFTVIATAYAVFLARLRLWSGSIWPPVIGHAAWNALTQAAFNPAVKPGLWPWLGESGIILTTVTVVIVALAVHFLRPDYGKK